MSSSSSPLSASSSSSSLSSDTRSSSSSSASNNPLARQFNDLTDQLDGIRSQLPVNHSAYASQISKDKRHAMQGALKKINEEFTRAVSQFLVEETNLNDEDRSTILKSIAQLNSSIDQTANKVAQYPAPTLFKDQKTKGAIQNLAKVVPKMVASVLSKKENIGYVFGSLEALSKRMKNVTERLPKEYDDYLSLNPSDEMNDYQFQLLEEIERIAGLSIEQVLEFIDNLLPSILEDPAMKQTIKNKLHFLMQQLQETAERLMHYPNGKLKETGERVLLKMVESMGKIYSKFNMLSADIQEASRSIKKLSEIKLPIQLNQRNLREFEITFHCMSQFFSTLERAGSPILASARQDAVMLYQAIHQVLIHAKLENGDRNLENYTRLLKELQLAESQHLKELIAQEEDPHTRSFLIKRLAQSYKIGVIDNVEPGKQPILAKIVIDSMVQAIEEEDTLVLEQIISQSTLFGKPALLTEAIKQVIMESGKKAISPKFLHFLKQFLDTERKENTSGEKALLKEGVIQAFQELAVKESFSQWITLFFMKGGEEIQKGNPHQILPVLNMLREAMVQVKVPVQDESSFISQFEYIREQQEQQLRSLIDQKETVLEEFSQKEFEYNTYLEEERTSLNTYREEAVKPAEGERSELVDYTTELKKKREELEQIHQKLSDVSKILSDREKERENISPGTIATWDKETQKIQREAQELELIDSSSRLPKLSIQIEENEARIKELDSFLENEAYPYIREKEIELEKIENELIQEKTLHEETKADLLLQLGNCLGINDNTNQEVLKASIENKIIQAIRSGDRVALQGIMLALIREENPASDEIFKGVLKKIWLEDIANNAPYSDILSLVENMEKMFPKSMFVKDTVISFAKSAIQKFTRLNGSALAEITPYQGIQLSDLSAKRIEERNAFNLSLQNLINRHLSYRFIELKREMQQSSREVEERLATEDFHNPLDRLQELSSENRERAKAKLMDNYTKIVKNAEELIFTEKTFQQGMLVCEEIMKSTNENTQVSAKKAMFEFGLSIYHDLGESSERMQEILEEGYRSALEGKDIAQAIEEGERFQNQQLQEILKTQLLKLKKEDIKKIMQLLSELEGKEGINSQQILLELLKDIDLQEEATEDFHAEVAEIVVRLSRHKVLKSYIDRFVPREVVEEAEAAIKEHKERFKTPLFEEGVKDLDNIILKLSHYYMQDAYLDSLIPVSSATDWLEYFTYMGNSIQIKSDGKDEAITKKDISYFEQKRKYVLNIAAIKEQLDLSEEEKTKVNNLNLESLMIFPAQRLPRIKLILENILKETKEVDEAQAERLAPVKGFMENLNKVNNGIAGIISSYARQIIF